MDCIYVTMFGTPEVYKNNERIVFPFKKVEALFYYIIINKTATREELVGILWPDIDEETARKNLRNALYRIKKTFEMDIIISPRKSDIILNMNISIYTDIYEFNGGKGDYIKLYRGEFLNGFYVKDADSFEMWLREKRDFYKDMYISRLYKDLQVAIDEDNSKVIEEYSKLIINLDPFDERAYRILMEYYLGVGYFNRGIDIYIKLSKLLEEELGITPDSNTAEVYNRIRDMKSAKELEIKGIDKTFFYGREDELKIISRIYYNFLNKKDYKSALIIGEAGIGKTRLKDKFLSTFKDDVYIIEANCYQFEEEYFLKPWNVIFSIISDIAKRDNIIISEGVKNVIGYIFPSYAIKNSMENISFIDKMDGYKYQVAEEAVMSILDSISKDKKIIIIFEDIQWMDTTSMKLLESIILHNKDDILFICTARNGYDKKIDKFTNPIIKYNRLKKIEIKRFTKDETEKFIGMAINPKYITNEISEKIYSETEGNTFFIVEFLNSIKEKRDINIMSSKIHDILKSRFIDISEEGIKILNIASMFFGEIPMDVLIELSGKDEFEIADIIEELEERYIIKEISVQDKILFEFTHQKLREYIYMNQSLVKRRILHNRIGLVIESQLRNDKSDEVLYSKLIYHFLNGGDKVRALYYSIKNALIYLDFSHELFPIIKDFNIQNGSMYVSREQGESHIKRIGLLLDEIKSCGKYDDKIKNLEISYLHIKGRYLIREGDYDRGVDIINTMIKNAVKIGNLDYALKGYRQIIYYGIQTHRVEIMDKYIETALDMASENDCMEDIGILLRLKGLNYIMKGLYNEAEGYLKQAINIFNIINNDNKYVLNIAASYNYIGEIRRHTMKFWSAIKYYDKAIEICEKSNVITGITVFTTNAGQAAFEMGDYITAKEYFIKSFNIYERQDIAWGRSTAEGFMSLLYVKEGNYKEALIRLKNADKFSQKLKSPYEKGIVYRIKAEIGSNMKNNKNLYNEFKDYLDEDIDEYCRKGIELLNKVNDSYEIDILNAIKNN